MKILVAGAGIGGLAFAALARQRGVEVALVEAAAAGAPAGYAITLYPMGSRVLHGLGLHEAFLDLSSEFSFYDVHDGRGRLLHRFDMRPISREFGKIGQIERGELVALLHAAAADIPLRHGVRITALHQEEEGVRAEFSDGSASEWDAVVAADGMRSQTRDLVFDYQPRFETGWGLWVWWTGQPVTDPGAVSEFWGVGRFAGCYPTAARTAAVVAGPRALLSEHAVDGDGRRVRAQFTELSGRASALVETFPDDAAGLYYRELSDHRSRSWRCGRVVLLGDAACSFLPAAGVGASMALESAAVLADEVSRADARSVAHAFRLYEKRRRGRAEAAQDDAHNLAAWLSTSSPALAWTRDQFLRLASVNSLAATISRSLAEPI